MKSNPARQRLSAKTIVGLCCLGVFAIVVVPGLILVWRIHQNAPQFISSNGSTSDFEFAGYKFASHEVKFRSKTTGSVLSVPLRDLWEGKATVRVDNGDVSVSSSRETSSLPSWLPAYPNSVMIPRNMDVKMREAVGSTVMFATKDPVAKVVRFYETKLYEAEFGTQVIHAGVHDEITKVTGIKGEAKYIVTLNIYLSGDQTVVMAGFLERKP
ncbi:MAG: hypothetical protein JNM65_09125 [Verrucomicrobiaceae bacterium]|nr:hypothetical protein [Verrucomicrobiaceae bacterium]